MMSNNKKKKKKRDRLRKEKIGDRDKDVHTSTLHQVNHTAQEPIIY